MTGHNVNHATGYSWFAWVAREVEGKPQQEGGFFLDGDGYTVTLPVAINEAAAVKLHAIRPDAKFYRVDWMKTPRFRVEQTMVSDGDQ